MGRFTRRLQTEPAQAQKGGVPQVNSELARELVDLGALDFTGELIVSFQESSHSASIFFFEGAPYACTLAHMQGHPLARLVSAGRISTSDRRSIDELVDQGVITAETLGVVNQEFFLDQIKLELRKKYRGSIELIMLYTYYHNFLFFSFL